MSDFVIRDGYLSSYTGYGGDIVIPEGVTKIGREAFHRCARVTSVVIPGSVTEIGDRAFSECRRLTNVTICDGVTKIADSAFGYCIIINRISHKPQSKG